MDNKKENDLNAEAKKIKELDNIIKRIEGLKIKNTKGMVILLTIEKDEKDKNIEKRNLETFKNGISIEQILPVLEIVKHSALKEVGILDG
jgi:hypothetical protein